MSVRKLNPYVKFDGTAEEALALYERALGARVEHLMRWGEMPGAELDPAEAKRIMHAELWLGEDAMLMMADAHPDRPVGRSDQVSVCLHFDDESEMRARFDTLAIGGSVTMPIHETFWGASFGVLTDAYGVAWLFDCPK